MQIKVKIISGTGPNETLEFSSFAELGEFAKYRDNLTGCSQNMLDAGFPGTTYTGDEAVHNSQPVPQKRGIIARIFGN